MLLTAMLAMLLTAVLGVMIVAATFKATVAGGLMLLSAVAALRPKGEAPDPFQ